MSNIWERFDRVVNAEKVMDTKSQFKKLPAGIYEANLIEIKPDVTKNGSPMLKGRFKIKSNNRLVFYNHTLQNINYPEYNDSNTAEGVSFFEDLTGEDYEFTSLSKFAEDVANFETDEDYTIEVKYDDKDVEQKWAKISIVLPEEPLNDIDGDEDFDDLDDDDDVPF